MSQMSDPFWSPGSLTLFSRLCFLLCFFVLSGEVSLDYSFFRAVVPLVAAAPLCFLNAPRIQTCRLILCTPYCSQGIGLWVQTPAIPLPLCLLEGTLLGFCASVSPLTNVGVCNTYLPHGVGVRFEVLSKSLHLGHNKGLSNNWPPCRELGIQSS